MGENGQETLQGWSTEEVVSFLRDVELFEGLPGEELERVAAIVGRDDLPAGEVLFEEGEPGEVFYIIHDGAVEILKDREDGGQEKLAVRRVGEGFGEMALLNDAPRSATARVIEDASFLTITRSDFHGLMEGQTLAFRVMRTLSKALRALGMRFAASEKLATSRGDTAPDPDEVSRIVQRGLLPRNAPRLKGYDIAAGTTTEEHGRGDTVWDWIELKDGRTAILAYDVQGTGLPPSHFLMSARAVVRALATEYADVREILRRANTALSAAAVVGVDQFVECGIAVLGDGGVDWTAAGRVPAGLIGREGTFEEFGSSGPPLGMMEGFRYSVQPLDMGPGDTFVVLSQASMGLFRGAADLVAQVQGKPAGEVVQTLHRAIRKAHGEAPEETSVIFIRKH